uniref:Zinc finger CHC2-type domain-containing protein n=1 Tax=Panagrolaimus sp. JU765 TaxID=591449 RepID=A0AC34RJP2_9BILA
MNFPEENDNDNLSTMNIIGSFVPEIFRCKWLKDLLSIKMATSDSPIKKNQQGFFCFSCGEMGTNSSNHAIGHKLFDDFSKRIWNGMLEMVGKAEGIFEKHILFEMVSKFCTDYGAETENEKNDHEKYYTYMIKFNNQDHANAAFEERMENIIKYRQLSEEWKWKTAENNLREDAENDETVKILSQIFYTGYTINLRKRRSEHYCQVFRDSCQPKVDPKVAFISRSLSSCIKRKSDNTWDVDNDPEQSLTIYTVLDGLSKLQARTAELLINVVLNNHVMCSESTANQSIYSLEKIGNDKIKFRTDALKLGAYLVLSAINRISNGKAGDDYFPPEKRVKKWINEMTDPDETNKKLKNALYEKMMSLRSDAKTKTPDPPSVEKTEEDLSDEQKAEITIGFEKFGVSDDSESSENEKN